jgi:hypothetical protein
VANPSSSSATLARKEKEVDYPLSLLPFLISMHGDAIQYEPWLRVPAWMLQKCTAEKGNKLLHASGTWICSSRMTARTRSCQEIEKKILDEIRFIPQKVSLLSNHKSPIVLRLAGKLFPC